MPSLALTLAIYLTIGAVWALLVYLKASRSLANDPDKVRRATIDNILRAFPGTSNRERLTAAMVALVIFWPIVAVLLRDRLRNRR